MNIRAYHKNDKENIIQLVKGGLAEFGFEYSQETSESDLANVESEYFGNNGTFVILENDNRELLAVGAIKEVEKRTFKIRKMYVAKNQRGKGFGKVILDYLLQTAKEKGAKKVVLETSTLMTSAIGLYKKFGFKKTYERPSSPRCDFTFTKTMKDD
ncbi:GNAT family N-acetyltransferase [Muricauda sp. JGD-17]|uniref:GNAT family N-acetyltransferase n=1 Tax=Flagellimonas ochracea TaxID=2696472 RepID=A0A964TA55_9FLAO|nr:GNAT family N-acetyltransferase [Allomuricauda ochracea]NAY91077.1 GNAT family N-acetyltransferase [Allomuricauda ochracea]